MGCTLTGGGRAYGQLLRTPGVPRLGAAYFALGTASSMTPVSLVLFAREATQSFAAASLVLAAATAGGLVLGPLRGRLVDRVGPSAAVLGLAAPSVATDVAFILAGHAHLATVILAVLGFVAGAVTAPAGAALRSVWSDMLGETGGRQAGYAALTVMQELTFIAGPLLAGALIALWSTTAAVATAAVLSLLGAVVFATSLAARARVPTAPADRGLPALASAGLRTVVATAAAFGLAFGVLDIALPAFARSRGSTAAAGVLLAALAGGIGVGGLVYGMRPWRTPPSRQYTRLCLLAAVGLAPLCVAPSLAAMIPLAFIAGLCFAPTTTCQIAVIDELSSAGRGAEAFTWIGTLYGAGAAVGAVLAGQLIEASAVRAAIVAAGLAALTAWAIAASRSRTLQQAAPGRAP